ncbi:DUF1847 domain-containing protein [Roseimarinus sediminis]|jgi:uncharacterized metal-binding protein|uniref:DUF1847 domain-containing protein n=1 Tax=Roseimarinus sediminis TaxID=1610899 RepID=UPI003D23EF89
MKSIAQYNTRDREIMKYAEAAKNKQLDRVDELLAFASLAGIKTIGIAYCVNFRKQAESLSKILSQHGFEVFSVDCKYGKIKKDELLPGTKGLLCNPAGQASYLKEHQCELNIMMGLCVGHDMVFNLHSEVPVSPLIVKDRIRNHYPNSRFESINEE